MENDNIEQDPYPNKVNIHQVTDTNLLNLNGGMLAAIEIITTGMNPDNDSIIQICILPLNSQLNPHQGILPFYSDVAPLHRDKLDFDNLPRGINKARIFKSMKEGMHAWKLADLLVSWVDKIKFKKGKKIFPLAHNWFLKREFMIRWLGYETFDYIFDYRVRDLLSASLYSNDRADFQVEQIPYPKQNLTYLSAHCSVEYTTCQDALDNAKSIVEIYKSMVSAIC